MNITITLTDVDPELVDEAHDTGLTDRGYTIIVGALLPYASDVDVEGGFPREPGDPRRYLPEYGPQS